MALLPERWELLRTGNDPASDQPYAQISRKSGDFVSVWKLKQDAGEWRVESMFASNQTLKVFPGRGLRLTVSRIDTILRSFAEGDGFPEGA